MATRRKRKKSQTDLAPKAVKGQEADRVDEGRAGGAKAPRDLPCQGNHEQAGADEDRHVQDDQVDRQQDSDSVTLRGLLGLQNLKGRCDFEIPRHGRRDDKSHLASVNSLLGQGHAQAFGFHAALAFLAFGAWSFRWRIE